MSTLAFFLKLFYRKLVAATVYGLGVVLVIYFFIMLAWFITTLGFGLNILK